MNAWPVIERELRVRSRHRSTAATRFAAALIAALVCAGTVLMLQKDNVPAVIGQRLFHLLSQLLLFVCLLIGAATTSDTLSSEKREGTLGLLFLSNLSRFDIVIGKLASASLSSFFGLLAGMPVLAVSIAMGGVAQGEFWRTMLALINALFFALAAGMAISAFARESANSLIAALALTLAWTLFPMLIRILINVFGAPPMFDVSILSPWRACQLAAAPAYQAHPVSFWQSIAILQFLSWSLLAIAARRVGRLDRPATPPRLRKTSATPHRSRIKTAASTGSNPAVWLYLRRMPRGVYKWLLTAIALLGCLAISLLEIRYSTAFRLEEIIAFMAVWIWFAGAGFKLWIAAIACQLTAEARRSGELEVLLTTPIGDRKTVLAQAVALRRAFKAPAITLLIGQMLAIAIISFAHGNMGDSLIQFGFAAAVMSALWLVMVIDLFAVGWLGLWQGVISRTARLALLKTVLIVMTAPWLWLLLPQIGWILAFLSPFYSMGIMGSAQTKLRTELSQALGRHH